MLRLKYLFSLLFLTLPLTLHAQDDMSPLWERTGRWEIRVDTTLDYGCFAMLIEADQVFRIGINNTNSTVRSPVKRTV